MAITINFDEKSATKLDLDGDGKIDRATVVADLAKDGKSISGMVYVALAADGFTKENLITRDFSRKLATSCQGISTRGQQILFSCDADPIDAAAIVRETGAGSSQSSESMQFNRLDKEIAEHAGFLGALRDDSQFADLGGTGLNADMMNGIGGLIGTKGPQMGSSGLTARGSGLSGGGTAEGLAGLGTKDKGSGASGYGSGSSGLNVLGTSGNNTILLGAMDKSLIDAVIKRNMAQIRYCYQRELTNKPDLAGRATIKFVIFKDGTVSSATVKTGEEDTHWNHPDIGEKVGAAICDRFLKFQFPEPKGGGIVIVDYPFVFSPG